MEVISSEVVKNSWLIFWSSYWFFGGIISYYNIRRLDKVLEVSFNIFENMLWSSLGLFLMFHFPIRICSNWKDYNKFLISYVIASVYFYHIHYLLHHPKLYFLHKKHHRFQKPWALAGLYCSPFEMIFANTFTASLGPIMTQMSPNYVYFWNLLMPINVLLSHSGLTIPYFMDNSHDLHHRYFNFNYGINSVLDELYGTKM
jgi:sterol desaturase/sphingolipid hydroxylase (fatty acid hydroxylase superfamily)